MRKAVTALAVAGTIAAATVANLSTADARRGWWGPAVIGGIAAGAIIGSAFARPYYGYGYAPAASRNRKRVHRYIERAGPMPLFRYMKSPTA